MFQDFTGLNLVNLENPVILSKDLVHHFINDRRQCIVLQSLVPL